MRPGGSAFSSQIFVLSAPEEKYRNSTDSRSVLCHHSLLNRSRHYCCCTSKDEAPRLVPQAPDSDTNLTSCSMSASWSVPVVFAWFPPQDNGFGGPSGLPCPTPAQAEDGLRAGEEGSPQGERPSGATHRGEGRLPVENGSRGRVGSTRCPAILASGSQPCSNMLLSLAQFFSIFSEISRLGAALCVSDYPSWVKRGSQQMLRLVDSALLECKGVEGGTHVSI